MTTMLHALLTIRDLAAPEREAWRALFDHYVFNGPEAAAAHIPPPARGILGPIDADTAARLRAALAR